MSLFEINISGGEDIDIYNNTSTSKAIRVWGENNNL